jgi:hypothetical protein
MATAQGTAQIDFGAFPGKSDASLAITGQTGITAGALVEAWVFPADTADHSADEHMLETIKVVARDVVAGVGFTIYGMNTGEINEPTQAPRLSRYSGAGADAGAGQQDSQKRDMGGNGTRIYGLWNVAWVWNG